MRNTLIAAGNSGDSSLVPAVERLLTDALPPGAGDGCLALQRLVSTDVWDRAKARNVSHETDVAVRAEWGAEAG